MHTLTTPRLILRQWCAADLEPFAALNVDPAVMEFMPRCLARAESDAFAEHAAADLDTRGWGLWAVAERKRGEFLGCVGLGMPSFRAAFTPCVEILWRLRRTSWGLGFATEAAAECLRFGFTTLVLPEIVSFTVPANLRSRAVMERLGMSRDAGGDFDHPRLPPGHALRHHVLYRLTQPAWKL